MRKIIVIEGKKTVATIRGGKFNYFWLNETYEDIDFAIDDLGDMIQYLHDIPDRYLMKKTLLKHIVFLYSVLHKAKNYHSRFALAFYKAEKNIKKLKKFCDCALYNCGICTIRTNEKLKLQRIRIDRNDLDNSIETFVSTIRKILQKIEYHASHEGTWYEIIEELDKWLSKVDD